MKLYELNQKYQELLNYAQSVDFTDEEQRRTLNQTLESLDEAIEDKAINTAHVIKSLEYDELIVKEEIKRLRQKQTALKNNQIYLKNYLQTSMEQTNRDKIESPLLNIRIQNNRPSVEITDERLLNEEYFISQPSKPDKNLIKELIQEGVPVKGAELKQGRSLRIQ